MRDYALAGFLFRKRRPPFWTKPLLRQILYRHHRRRYGLCQRAECFRSSNAAPSDKNIRLHRIESSDIVVNVYACSPQWLALTDRRNDHRNKARTGTGMAQLRPQRFGCRARLLTSQCRGAVADGYFRKSNRSAAQRPDGRTCDSCSGRPNDALSQRSNCATARKEASP